MVRDYIKGLGLQEGKGGLTRLEFRLQAESASRLQPPEGGTPNGCFLAAEGPSSQQDSGNAKDAKQNRKGTQRRFSAILAGHFASFVINWRASVFE